ncbi:MAG TPA: phospholipase D-like domain-containing protein [Candidatus Dormibacteraeota bacterium]|nr:phospholipase D-like domain-containing protein [Candidatus Dormibacteraeota bacterium]
MSDQTAKRWFLSPTERGNANTAIDSVASQGRSWTEGNLVLALVHGARYFEHLATELEGLGPGATVWFTDWRGDRDERLRAGGPTVGALLAALAARGVDVRGLVWRSHPSALSFSEAANRRLEEEINRSGGQVLLDQRVLPFGSHHQKLVVVGTQSGPSPTVAFVGGIDLCHARRDDLEHPGDPQPQPMGRRYGARAPWHDVQLEVRGPAAAQLEFCFRERWDDPTPLDDRTPARALLARLSGEPSHPSPLPPRRPAPAPAGPHAVQVLRTYPRRHRPFPFARGGERSVARALIKAIGRAERLIYIEDQYLWSAAVAHFLAARLAARPALQVIATLPRWPDSDGPLTGPPNRIGQLAALSLLQQAGGSRFGAYDIENPLACPIYVHAKVCVIDDVWALVGSANFNLRSWTHDSELSCAVIDQTLDDRGPAEPTRPQEEPRVFARSLRVELWAEHLGRSPTDPELLNLEQAQELWRTSAARLADWHLAGAVLPHPPERVTVHSPLPIPSGSGWWAGSLYRSVYDPDGRPRSVRRRGRF